jgi:error-prone DNA polymerase
VSDENRALYHAAACVAANHVVALLGQVERLASAADVPFAAFFDIVRAAVDNTEQLADLPALEAEEEVFADYRSAGLSLKGHPVSFFRSRMDQLGIVPAAQLADLADGRFVRVGGLVLVRQRPSTAKGITFVTLEDETGVANLIVRMDVWERFHKAARTASALLAYGRLQKHEEVIHVLATKLENLAGRLNEMKSQSRDFH